MQTPLNLVMKLILLKLMCAFFLFFGAPVHAQFTEIIQSTTNSFYYVEVNESAGVSLAGGIKFIKSTDQGITWTELDLDGYEMPFTIFTYHGAVILDNNNYLLIGNDNTNKKSIVLRTSDGGNSWQMVMSSANNSYQYARDIASNGSTVMVATRNGVWRSTDAGLTFTFIPITTQVGTMNATTIEYFQTTGKWIWKYENNETFESSNNGITWTPLGGIGGTVTLTNKLNVSATNGLWTNKSISPTLDTCTAFLLDGNGTIEQQLDFPSQLIQSGQLEEFFHISGTEYLAHDGSYFYLLDASDSTLEQFTHNLYSQSGGFVSGINDADMGTTFGLAVGSEGALSRFDASQPFDTRVYAAFSIPNQICPNEQLDLFPLNGNVDSVEWWIDNQLASNQPNYAWTVPASQSPIQVKLKIWKYGYVDSVQYNITTTPEIAPNQYNLSSGLTPCYGVSQQIYFQYGSGTAGVAGSYALCIYQGDTVHYSSPAQTTGFSSYTPPVYTNDTIFLYVARPQTCGYTLIDTFEYIIQAGLDMTQQFDFSTEDTLYCSMYSPYQINLDLTNLTPGLTYSVTNQSGANVSSFVASTDSVSISQTVSWSYNVYTEPQYAAHYVTYYLTVTGPNGCTSGLMVLDSIQLINPIAYFTVEPQAYFLNDTANVVNQFYAFYNDWTYSNPLVSVVNPNDTVPIITSGVSAAGSLQLANNPQPGCSDTASRDIYFGEVIPTLTDEVCFETNAVASNSIVDIMTDSHGNTIEVSTKPQGTTSIYSGRAVFNIAKRDTNGNLLWIKSTSSSSNIYKRCVIIDKVQIDHDDNVYAILRWDWSGVMNYEMINSVGQNRKSMIIKLDGQTGNMLWYSDVQSALVNAGLVHDEYEVYTLSDLELSPEGIYFGTSEGVGLLNNNGVAISYHRATPEYFTGFDYGTSPSYSSDNAILSPELELLSTGELVVAYTFRGGLEFTSSSESDFDLPTNQLFGTAIMKYNYLTGFSDSKLIAAGDYDQNDVKSKTFLKRDANDNLIMLFHVNNAQQYASEIATPFEMMDSVYYDWDATYILCLDSDFIKVWETQLTGFEIGDMEYALESNEFFVSGYAFGSIAAVSGDNVQIIGETTGIDNNYGGPFIAKFDENGTLTDGRFWYRDYSVSPTGRFQTRIATTPCGDLTWYANFTSHNQDTALFTSYGEEFSMAVPKVIRYSSDCSNVVCTYVSALNVDTIYICEGEDLEVNIPVTIYGGDTLVYHLVENSISLPSESTLTNLVPITNQTTEIVVESPVSVTYHISMVGLDSYSFNYDSMWCNTSGHNTIELVGVPSTHNYYWQSGSNAILNDTFIVKIHSSNPGSYYMPVVVITPGYCAISDSLHYIVDDVIDPNIQSSFSVGCSDTLVIPYNAGDYDGTGTWTLNGTPTTNSFSGANLNDGMNSLDLTLYSTYGCQWDETVSIDYCDNLGLEESQSGHSLILGPNPSGGNVFIETTSPMKSIKMLSIEGKEVLYADGASKLRNELTIDVENGMYWIIVETEAIQFRRSLIIQK